MTVHADTIDLLQKHFDTALETPDGIKKLRELILTLAMQGKLVPQDPNDQPASELLKEISAEKEKLIKEGNIKKQEPLSPIKPEEMPYELPKGWDWVRLGDISEYIQRGKGPKYSEERRIPVISQKCIQWSGFNKDVVKFIEPDSLSQYSNERFIRVGDLLWNSTGTGTLGRINIYGNELFEFELVVADSHVTVVRLLGVFKQFVLNFLISPYVQNDIEENASGTTNQIELNTTTVICQITPLPPLAEQKRIVARIDQLMSICDTLEAQRNKRNQKRLDIHTAAINQLLNAPDTQSFDGACRFISAHFDTLYSVKENVAELRKAILQLAVMGKLVKQDPNDQPASELLKEIAAEKAKLVKEGKIKKQDPLPPIKLEDVPYELPKGWEWVRLGEIVSYMDAGWSPQCENRKANENEWGVLKTTAVQPMCFLMDENKALPAKLKPRPDAVVEPGDILITRAGPRNRVAICCFVAEIRSKLMLSDKIIRFKYFPKIIDQSYGSQCLNAGFGAEQLERYKSGMAESQVNISQDKLKMVMIPLPPLGEQKRIVIKIDQLVLMCDELEKNISQASGKQEEIVGAVLARV